ncbi:MAG: hypothetical protein ABJE95_01275 [Byssovorax sp.]
MPIPGSEPPAAPALAYLLGAASPRFVAGEDIVLDLALVNRGRTPVELPDPESIANWQPTFSVTGPGPGDRFAFDRLSLARGRPSRPLPDSAAVLVAIPPGGAWRGRLCLGELARLGAPGRYVVESRLAWGPLVLDAAPLEITVTPLRAASAVVHLGGVAGGEPEIAAAWIHRDGDDSAVFFASFEPRVAPFTGLARRSVTRLVAAAPSASGLASPLAEQSLRDDWFGWVAFGEGAAIVAAPTNGDPPARLALDFTPDAVLAPAVQHPDHDLDLFVIGRDPAGGLLALTRFSDGQFASDAEGRVAWSLALSFVAVSGAVAAQPGTGSRFRHVVLVESAAGRVRIHHALIDGRGPPRRFDEITVDDAEPLDEGPPALFAERSGVLHVAILVAAPGDRARCRLVDLAFAPRHEGATVEAVTPIDLPSPAVAARLGTCRRDDGHRRDWAIRSVDGAVHAAAGAGTRTARPSSESPLCLLVLERASYLLDPAPGGGLTFVEL